MNPIRAGFAPRSAIRRGVIALIAMGIALAVGVAPVQGRELDDPVSGTPNFYDDESANFAASQMGQRLLAELPEWDSYAGLQIVRQGIQIDTVGAPPGAMRAAAAAGAGSFGGEKIPIIYRSVARSERSLKALGARVMAARSSWLRSGINISSWKIDLASNTVEVSLARYSTQAARRLTDAYGRGVTIRAGDEPTAPVASRLYDEAPWTGGSKIYLAGTTCTSWFSLQSSLTGGMYNATAAHCGTGTVSVCSGYFCTAQGVAESSRVRWTNGGNTDVVLYPVDKNAPWVWADPTTTRRAVTSRATADPIGTLVCTSGHRTGEVCRVRITAIGAFSYNGKTLNNLVYCEQIDRTAAFIPGDSGGPVYAAKNGTLEAQAFGMILAKSRTYAEGWYGAARYILAAYTDLTFTPYR